MDFYPIERDSLGHAEAVRISPMPTSEHLACHCIEHSNFRDTQRTHDNRQPGQASAAQHTQETIMPSFEGDKRRFMLQTAASDTLMNIAGVSGSAAKDLRPGQSLVVDLGLDTAELRVLARYQGALGERLSGRDPRAVGSADSVDTAWPVDRAAWQGSSETDPKALIDPDEMLDLMVWEVLDLTLRRALSIRLEEAELTALIMQSRAELRSPPR